MTTTRIFELAIKEKISNSEAKRRYGRGGDGNRYVVMNRGAVVAGTGKKPGASKK